MRRGTSHIELALVLPVLLVMVFGIVEYGWFFSRQALISNAVVSSVRSGGVLRPDEGDADGYCTPCINSVTNHAQESMTRIGVVTDTNPTIIYESGTCAISLDVSVNHEPLIGLFHTPEIIHARAITLAQWVEGC